MLITIFCPEMTVVGVTDTVVAPEDGMTRKKRRIHAKMSVALVMDPFFITPAPQVNYTRYTVKNLSICPSGAENNDQLNCRGIDSTLR
jgi:hypothetical protein